MWYIFCSSTARRIIEGVCRPTVKDGLLEDRPRQGGFIRKYTLQDILEIYDLREVTAGLCARYAALNMTNKDFMELHDKIVDYSRAKITPDIISNFHISLLSFNIGLIRDPEETVREHREIIDSLRAGNSVNAENLMREHIRKSREVLARRMQAQE